MSIVAVDPPAQKRSGRQPRLSDEDVKDLAATLKSGSWASEDELVGTKTAAYQRAKSAIKLVMDQFKDDLAAAKIVDLTSRVSEVEQNGKPMYRWYIGPLKASSTPRQRKPKEEKAEETPASA